MSGSGERSTSIQYEARDSELWRIRTTSGRDAQARRIANFVPHVIERAELHDGHSDPHVSYTIELKTAAGCVTVEADAQHPLAWIASVPGLFVETHQSEYIREAIERDAVDAPTIHHYGFTGWLRTDDGSVFLHGAGAIGADGTVDGLSATLDDRLAGYHLPDPPDPDQTADIVRAVVDAFVAAADPSITLPLLAAVARAPLGAPARYLVHLAGATGAGKTSLALLAASWFGAALARTDTPVCAWTSTPTDLEIVTANAHDVVIVVDDYLATAAHERTADRLVRTTTGGVRGRRRADLTARATYRPGGLIISTGEDHLGRASAQARALTIRATRSTRAAADAFNAARDAAEHGQLAAAMSAYVQHLADERDQRGVQADGMPYGWDHNLTLIRSKVAARIEHSEATVHPRQVEIVADLVTALARYMKWAARIGAYSRPRAQRYENDALDICCGAVADTAVDEAADALTLLRSAMASGRGHVTSPGGVEPPDGHLWGWNDRRPGGPCVGYLRTDSIDLLPDAVVDVLRTAEHHAGTPVNVSRQQLAHLWAERGWLVRNTARGTFGERRRISTTVRVDVWPVALELFNAPDGAP